MLFGLLTGAVWLAVGTASADAPAAAPSTATETSTATTPPSSGTTAPPSTATVTQTVSATASVTTTRTVAVTVTAPASTRTTSAAVAPVTATVTKTPQEKGANTSLSALIIALVVLVLAAVGLGYYLLHRNRGAAHASGSDWDAGLARMTSTVRWISGQAGQIVHPAMSRTERARRWATASATSTDLQRSLSDAQRGAPDQARAARALALTQALAALRGAGDALLRVDAGPPSDERDERTRGAAEDVAQRRRELDDLLESPPPVTPGAVPS